MTSRRKQRQEEHMSRLRSLSNDERERYSNEVARCGRQLDKTRQHLEAATERLGLIIDADQGCSLEGGYHLRCRAVGVLNDVARLLDKSEKRLERFRQKQVFNLLEGFVRKTGPD